MAAPAPDDEFAEEIARPIAPERLARDCAAEQTLVLVGGAPNEVLKRGGEKLTMSP
jgi:hypothetical protein